MKLSVRSIKKNPIVAIGLMAFAVTPAHAVNYSFSDMGGLSDLANPIFTRGINNHGHVIGLQSTSEVLSAVQWNGSSWSPLVNPIGTDSSAGLGINDSGQVVGTSFQTGVDVSIPVRWDNGLPTRLDSVNNYDTPAAINNAGQVFGLTWSNLSNPPASRPAIWEADGSVTELPTLGGDTPGGATAIVYFNNSINEAGVAAGTSYLPFGDAWHGTAWIDSVAYDLGTLGGTFSEANSINNVGQIVGVANLADETPHPVLWNDFSAAPIDLGTLGGPGGMAVAINDNGLIAGWSDTAEGASHLTLWDHGQIIDLTAFIPAELTAAGWHSLLEGNNSALSSDWLDMNNAGEIVSMLYDNSDHAIPILLTPTAVPLPGAVWLFGSALAGFMGAAKRKKLAA